MGDVGTAAGAAVTEFPQPDSDRMGPPCLQNMPLDALVNVIDTLKKRIATHRQSFQQNETRTRMALIDPLLTALGWDVSDLSLVTPEYSVGKGRADYALNGPEIIPAAIVEAKRLGHTLDDDERIQMLNYANARGVRYAAVTDGNIWELYEVFKQAPLEDRRRLNLKIVGTPAHKLALGLLLLWRPNLASGAPTEAQEPVSETKTERITEALHPPVDTPLAQTSSAPPLPISSPPVGIGWVKLSDCNPPNRTKAPEEIKFPDGTKELVGKWKDLLVVTGKWLKNTGKLASVSSPILSGPRERALDDDCSKFRDPTSISGTKFWLNTSGSAANMRNRTKALLNHCNISPDHVFLRFADAQMA